MRRAFVLLLVVGCASAPTISPEEARRAAEAKRQRDEQNRQGWRDFCAPPMFDRRSSRQELWCGDFVFDYEADKAAMVPHWRAALAKAQTQDEQCPAIQRIRLHSTQPSVDLADVDSASVMLCEQKAELDLQQRRIDADIHARTQIERANCIQRCRSDYNVCVGGNGYAAPGCAVASVGCQDQCKELYR